MASICSFTSFSALVSFSIIAAATVTRCLMCLGLGPLPSEIH